MEITYASPSSQNLSSSSQRSSSYVSMPAARPVKVIPLQHPETTSSCSAASSFGALVSKRIGNFKRMTWIQWIETLLPCSRWIRTYKWREYFQVDLMAGTTVGIMLVPQAMSYAKLAGLQPIYGLYSGFVPIFVYAIFGSSRQLAIGPVALVSLLVSNVLGGIADSSDELYTELAILLALMVGIFESIMGLLSHAVISGFTTASAIVIALSQAKYFLGYDVARSSKIVPLIKSIILGADKVGDIPQGLPNFSIPKSFECAMSLIPTAILITGVAILESVGIAKALAAKNGYELDSNQELFGLGVANILGSFFSAYPTTGSFSRSAVNHESGAKTGLSGVITGIIMACALLFMTPLFEHIPQCALAAIVVSAVMGLVDYDEAIFLWHVDKKDFLLWTITSITTLFLGIEIGVLVGVGASLAFVIHESANPHIDFLVGPSSLLSSLSKFSMIVVIDAILGRLPGTTVYRNTQQYPEAYTYHGIVIVRIDAPIYFANISFIKDRLREYEVDVDRSTRRGPEVERIYFVILEMAPVTYIDSSAVQALKDLYQEYKSRGIQIAISNLNHEVLLTLSKSGVVDLIGKEWYFVRAHDAVQVCLQHVQSLKETANAPNPLPDDNLSFLQRLLKSRGEDLSIAELESGAQRPPDFKNTDPKLEPLLSRKT
ncbi:Sulfate transporter 4.1 [Citrus sinensis]|nr:Sulfate transporter 4.1 [Citrus sinensis]